MIEVSKLSGEKYYINADSIDFIETTPDTMLTLASGKRLLVLESASEIIDKVVAYKRKIFVDLPKHLLEALKD